MPDPAPSLLIVDDEADLLRSLRRILRLDGYQVETAASIAGLFARSNWDDFFAIILDRRLPDGMSDEVLPKLKETAPHAPVIIVTGYADLDGALVALRSGAEDYLIKPINPDALRATLRRLADKRRAEAALREREQEIALAQSAAGIGLWTFHWGTMSGTLSPEWWQAMGLDVVNATPDFASLVTLFHPDDRQEMEKAYLNATSGTTDISSEFRIVHPERGERWILARGRVELSDTGEEPSMRGIVMDVTERKQAEEEKRRLQEQLLERQRLATIGTTAAKLAHEIGNPLNGMSMSTQLLQQRLAKAAVADEQIHRLTRILSDEIARLSDLLQEFRSLSRREQFVFEPLLIPELVSEILESEVSHYTARDVEVKQAIPTDLPVVRADRAKLRQVLLNLCKNAVEAMPEGGTLSLKAEKIEGQLRIEVSDTGEGIPEDVNILEPFVTTKKEGTGLGLAIVQQIVAAHHGSLSYTSSPGQGTTFQLNLPLGPIRKGA